MYHALQVLLAKLDNTDVQTPSDYWMGHIFTLSRQNEKKNKIYR